MISHRLAVTENGVQPLGAAIRYDMQDLVRLYPWQQAHAKPSRSFLVAMEMILFRGKESHMLAVKNVVTWLFLTNPTVGLGFLSKHCHRRLRLMLPNIQNGEVFKREIAAYRVMEAPVSSSNVSWMMKSSNSALRRYPCYQEISLWIPKANLPFS